MSIPRAAVAAAAVFALVAAPAGAQAPDAPTLVGRAILPADATAPGPWPAAPDQAPAPAPGAVQPVGGFSALLNAGGGTWWAMPDNGFGSKANSASFLLRVYRVRPSLETRRGDGDGTVAIEDVIEFRDPGRHVPWPIVAEGTPERLLTGADFDPESLRIGPGGDFWVGEEFGPFLLHFDASGRLLEAPIPVPYVASPDNPLLPPGTSPNLGRSNGIEGMAIATDRRTLYPVLEGPLAGDPDPLRRWGYEYDIRRGRFTARRWQYRVTQPGNLVADVTALDRDRLLVLERDNSEGAAAAFKRVFVVDLRRTGEDGAVVKRELVNLLDVRDPALLSLPGRPGDIGLGDPFSMPYVTVESVLPLAGDRLAIVNDTNFGSRGRNPGLPDPSDFVVIRVPALGDAAEG